MEFAHFLLCGLATQNRLVYSYYPVQTVRHSMSAIEDYFAVLIKFSKKRV